MTICYHPDQEINREVAQEAIIAESIDIGVGYPPRRWTCPDCGASHSRGHAQAIGQHRCLRCGYVGTGGVMWDPQCELEPKSED
jgi:rubredoxin